MGWQGETKTTRLSTGRSHVARSRDRAKMVTVIVWFVVMVMYVPQARAAAATEMTMTIMSTRTDLVYNAALADPNEYSYVLMNSTLCSDVVNSALTVGTIVSCSATTFVDTSPGVKGTITLKTGLDGKTEAEKFSSVSAAIVSAAATETNWACIATDITLVPNPNPPAVATNTVVTMTLDSTRTDLTYGSSLADPTSYAATLMNSTMCSELATAVQSVGTITSCECTSHVDASPGVTSTVTLSVGVSETTETAAFLLVGGAIVTAAEAKTNWNVIAGDIKLVHTTTTTTTTTTVAPRSDCGSFSQLPPILLSFLLLYYVM